MKKLILFSILALALIAGITFVVIGSSRDVLREVELVPGGQRLTIQYQEDGWVQLKENKIVSEPKSINPYALGTILLHEQEFDHREIPGIIPSTLNETLNWPLPGEKADIYWNYFEGVNDKTFKRVIVYLDVSFFNEAPFLRLYTTQETSIFLGFKDNSRVEGLVTILKGLTNPINLLK